uniref:Polynucleotide kinase n=1 Tax=viral metagenome TaxID=1070528 RepID=A0A6C0CS41_9ZZZZ
MDPSNIVLEPSKKVRSKKLAIFDFDGTLVRPKEGRRFPKEQNDWEWLRPSVPDTLRKYAKQKYRIVIVTDQSKLWKVEMIKEVVKELKVPITVIIGMEKRMQKPNPSLFKEEFPQFESGSFFVGDAAGRPGDWADRDIQFAKNAGITFYTPEEIFDKPKVSFPTLTIPSHQEVIVMIGYPGSGKSSFVKEQLEPKGYVRIDGDVFTTGSKMVKEASKYSNKSIVFDATNPTYERRNIYIEFAKKMNIPIRCIWVTTPIEEALERIKERERETGIHIPTIALYRYRKVFEEPTDDECELVKI